MSKLKMQCSMGTEKENEHHYFNIVFYFANPEKDLPNGVENFNYYRSKSKFSTDEEADFYGSIVCDATRTLITEFESYEEAYNLLARTTNKLPCPEDLKKEIVEIYNNPEFASLQEEENKEFKKEDLN